jgi:hypothetical protein
MTAIFATALQILSCFGFGGIILRLVRLDKFGTPLTRIAIAFAIGIGTLGWLMFFVGIAGFLSNYFLVSLLVIGTFGIPFLWDRDSTTRHIPLNLIDWVLTAGIIVALFFDLLEGLSPPADGDSMAYHFDLPKEFILAGRVEFVPRIIDGAIPLLIQMTYIPVLEIGGEKAMTLWTMASGWGTAALLFFFARTQLVRSWSLALTLIYLTTPAVVFAGGSGHVETKLAIFVLIAALFIAESLRTNMLHHTAMAGLGIGFFMGAKYTGLLFAGVCGIVLCGLLLFSHKKWFLHGTVLVFATFLAGSQWYIWNWIHTGDPVFPILFNLIDYGKDAPWDLLHHELLQVFLAEKERSAPINLWWFMIYPFVATFNGLQSFESGRVGMGLYAMLLLPFALGGAWRFRQKLSGSMLWSVVLIVILYYSAWFFTGNSQRIRHLLPIYPLLLICLSTAAQRWVVATGYSRPLILATFLSIGIQLGGHGVFTINYARHIFSNETRDQFLTRNVGEYRAIQWINKNLTATDKVYSMLRHVNYLFEVPNFYAHFLQEATTDIRPSANNPKLFLHQLNKFGITHILASGSENNGPKVGFDQWKSLAAMNCLEPINKTKYFPRGSRTLPIFGQNPTFLTLYRIKNDVCRNIKSFKRS